MIYSLCDYPSRLCSVRAGLGIMKEILTLFSEHGTFVQPDALSYISSKEKPHEFAHFLIGSLREYPLLLTLDAIKGIEIASTQVKEIPPISTPPVISTLSVPVARPVEPVGSAVPSVDKEMQKRMLSKLLSGPKSSSDSEDDEDEDTEDDEQGSKGPSPLMPPVIKPVQGWHPLARDYEAEVKVLSDVTGKRTSEGTTDDFASLFKHRYHDLREILRSQRREMATAIPISRIKKTMTDVSLIGIVREVRTTPKGHRVIELEDETGAVTLMALKGFTEVFPLACEVMLDEVIGVIAKFSKQGDLLLIQNIVFPDVKMQHDRKRTETPVCAAFLSDIHIGSKMFMQDEWTNFLRWINGDLGNSRQRDVASRLKYVVLPGDLVDGIGIYPGQEKELSITNIYDQYKALAAQFQLIPNHITIIVQPGNHDAVRPAEPQPAFEAEIKDLFTGAHYVFLGNPCTFSLHGVEVLSYHGQSLLDYSTNIQALSYNEPTEVMKLMLRKRHLAPTYGGYTPLAPEHTDYMIIQNPPDIFVTGHVHTSKLDTYRGITLINASSWQSQTSYQKMLNFVPDSAKLPIVDLKTGNATTMDFSKKS
jgi:DNA polymerase II small subunit